VIMAITGHSTRQMFDRYNTVDGEDTWEGIEALGVFLQDAYQTAYKGEKIGPAETGPGGISR